MGDNPKRLYYLDWLRVLAMLAVFLFHADRFFDYYDWHVKNDTRNLISSIHVAFFVQWMMPLFFILSGAAAFYSLKFRSGAVFLGERVKRLLVPLVFMGYFITSPPQMYFERLTHNRFEGSFWEFIPAYFDGVDMFGGNFPWHAFHLWYLLYLFVFSIILLPLFKSGRNGEPSVATRLSTRLEGRWRLMLLAIPLIMVNVFIDFYDLGFMRGTGGWDLFSYLFLLIYGYLFFCNQKIQESIKAICSTALVTAILLSITGLVIRFGIKPEISENTPVLYLTVTVMRCSGLLLWMIAIIGFGEKYLNFNNRFLEYAGEAVLPFYILHQFVLLLVGYWVVQWQVNTVVKLIAVAGLSFVAILGIYDLVIKRFRIAQLLFGLK